MTRHKIIRHLLALIVLALAAPSGWAATLKIAYLEIENDARYDEARMYFRNLMQPLGQPFSGAEVAVRESAFAGKTVGIDFALQRVKRADSKGLLESVMKLHKEGVRFFLIDATAPVVAEVAKATRGKDLLLFNVSAPDDELRQEQCQAHLLHTLPNYAMTGDAIAQFLVSKKWQSILLLEGPLGEDKLMSGAFVRSAKRFGLKIADKRPFVLSNDPRQRDQGNVALLSTGAEYDAVFVADSEGEFARSLPYRTVRARPVLGSEGLVATAWHWSWDRYGASQLNGRLEKLAARRMAGPDWAAWMAVKAIVEAVVRTNNAGFPKLASYLKSEEITLDGFKGNRLGFRSWDNQLRQPILLATHNAVIEQAPIAGFLHQANNMDTLGFDKRDSRCAF